VTDKLKRIVSTYKNKINLKCRHLLTSTLVTLMHHELEENLVKCLNDRVDLSGLRLFQMERMVMRANQDSTILMNDPSIPVHVVFNKAYLDKYSYDCSEAKTTHYVYHLLEVLCTECGFCTLEDIGNILLLLLSYFYKHLIYYYIALCGFEYCVPHKLETELLLSLYLTHGSSRYISIYYKTNIFILLGQIKSLMAKNRSGGYMARKQARDPQRNTI